MASQDHPPEAAAAGNAEQPSPVPEDAEKTMTSSSDQVQLQEDGSKGSSGTRVFRLVFCGKTVFEHRNSSSSHAWSSSSASGGLLSSSGSNSPLPPPQPPVVPDWVMALASGCRGGHVDAEAQPRFLMSKKLTRTDLDSDENRLHVPTGFVRSNIIPLLSDDEKRAASLDEYHNKKRKREETQNAPAPEVEEEGGEELLQSGHPYKKRKKMDKGREHGGLQVTAWTRSRWRFTELRLTCWDGKNATVLKGEHLKYLYDRSFLREGDQAELWGFRDVHGQLHLSLHKAAAASSPPTC